MSHADIWRKKYPIEGRTNSKVLRQEYAYVFKNSKGASVAGVNKEKHSKKQTLRGNGVPYLWGLVGYYKEWQWALNTGRGC